MVKQLWAILLLCPLALSADSLYLKNGALVKGEILKEDESRVIVDLGYTLLQIPRSEIVRQEKKPVEGQDQFSEETSGCYSIREMEEASVKANVSRFGEAVVMVSTPSGLGSGFVIHAQGYVVTNFHVIAGERTIAITVYKQRQADLEKIKYRFVKIVATNPFLDLALLKIEADPAQKETPLPEFKVAYLGAVETVSEGDRVFCIGTPLGMERSVSDGIVSSKTRQFNGRLYLQTTAPINPGNSGGPLFNMKGQVIGITNMKILFGDNLGFAIPVNYLKDFLKNRDAFAFDKDNPNSGILYYDPPRKKQK